MLSTGYSYFTILALTNVLTLVIVVAIFLTKRYNYWTNKGVYQFKPTWIIGNTAPVLRKQVSFGEFFTNLYKDLVKNGRKYGGFYIFTQPVLMVTDLDLVKRVCTSDYQYFASHGGYFNEEQDPLNAHLFNIDGDKWRRMRIRLTPTFTSGKMKMMFHIMQDCTSGFKDMLDGAVKNNEAVDIKDILGRFTTDVIGRCAFGIDCNSIKDPDTEFRYYGKKLFNITSAAAAKQIIFATMPEFVRNFFNQKLTPADVEAFFMKAVKDTVKYREENNVVRKDFMHLLLQLKNKGKISDDDDFKEEKIDDESLKITVNELAAQCFVFFLAGFETSSTTMSFALYELATNQEVQEKVRRDINDVLSKHDGQVSYYSVNEMHYLDRTINETLRMHTPIMALPRACTKDYKIPDSNIIIKKGTQVSIPIQGIHMDPRYYPNPEIFDPDRFTEENKAKRPAIAFLPFGEGPRICIGLRFGVLQAKVGLIALLRNYKFTLNEKTKLPLVSDKSNLVNAVEGGVWLNVSNI